jgi:hypothetical protein
MGECCLDLIFYIIYAGLLAMVGAELYFLIEGVIVLVNNRDSMVEPWQLWICILINIVLTVINIYNSDVQTKKIEDEEKEKEYFTISFTNNGTYYGFSYKSKNKAISALSFCVSVWFLIIRFNMDQEYKNRYRTEYHSLWRYTEMYATFLLVQYGIIASFYAIILLMGCGMICSNPKSILPI